MEKNTLIGTILSQQTIYEPEQNTSGYYWVVGTMNEEEKKIYSVWYELCIEMSQREEELEKMKESKSFSENDLNEYDAITDRIEYMAAEVFGFLIASIRFRIPDCGEDIQFIKEFKIIQAFEGVILNN